MGQRDDRLSENQKCHRSHICPGGVKQYIIYPFGEYGALTKKILNESFGIREKYIADNRLSKFNREIKSLDYFAGRDVSDCIILLTNANPEIHEEVRQALEGIFADENIVDIFPKEEKKATETDFHTRCGKYSYGPLCNHPMVESVGAFCSFAVGADAVVNHLTDSVTTHSFVYWDEGTEEHPGYFPGVSPRGELRRIVRIKVGNDVWLGKNVIITNSANIGNGVIAGAGAVITKDVPDYAVVAGVPARIIRYRFTPEQIELLNQIAWWDWPDEKIRACYDDFFEPVEVFIDRHRHDQK